MATKNIPGAVATDVTVALALDPPARGCLTSRGTQLVIPPDWFARCNAGEQVDGCNYSKIEQDGSLYVSDVAQSRTANPVYTTGLRPADLSAFVTRLNAAVVVVGATVADAQAEKVP